jgi:hypothetical protein
MTLPKIITSRKLAEVLDNPSSSDPRDRWSPQRAARWLQSTGAGVKRGGKWITTPERLIEHFPEAFAELSLASASRDLDGSEEHDGAESCEKCASLAEMVSELENQVIDLANRLQKAGVR